VNGNAHTSISVVDFRAMYPSLGSGQFFGTGRLESPRGENVAGVTLPGSLYEKRRR
jgi:hypothetical protein